MGTLLELSVQTVARLIEVPVVPPDLEADAVRGLASVVELVNQDGVVNLHGLSAADALGALADMANSANLGALSYEADISPIDNSYWEWLRQTCQADRASLWALDSVGRTRFQLHGLQLRSSSGFGLPREDDGTASRHAVGMNSRVSVRFTLGHLRLTFLDTATAELVIGSQAIPAD